MQETSPPNLRSLLSDAGYRVAFRTHSWVECLLVHGTERWVGHGQDEEEALADAVVRMLPAALGRTLLERVTGPNEAISQRLRVPPPSELSHPIAPPPVQETGSFATTRSVASMRVLTLEPPRPPPPPVEERTEEPRPAAPQVDTVISGGIVRVEPRVEPVRERPSRARIAEALEEVDKLLQEIEARLSSVARMAAERQRLNMLVWICRARAIEEALSEVPDVEQAVARVARRLTEVGKMFWPGSVRALQLSARPADVRREMHALWAAEPRTWRDATALADQLLRDHLQKSAEANLDEDGWADGAAKNPPPPTPEVLFAEVDAEVRNMAAMMGEMMAGRVETIGHNEVEALLAAARKLRWLRGTVRDDLAWGLAMGRLRKALHSLGDRNPRIRDVLDPKAKPVVPWGKLLGVIVDPPPEDANGIPTESAADLVADLPKARETNETLRDWLVRAFDVLSTPDLVALLVPLREQIETFDEETLNHPDRRIRRRLREIVRRISSNSEIPETELEAESDEPAIPEEPMAAQVLDALSTRVREHTAGRRTLFVSNREDPELGTKLSELLGIEITWCDGSLRRVQAQCERIARGSYDLVLSATGFQLHGVDGALARASNAVGVPYVRVNRGRPATCVQAIAREFGLTSGTHPAPVTRALAAKP